MANGYRIEYGPVGGATTVADVGTDLTYEQLSLDPGTEYQARVQYYEDDVNSDWTDWVYVETLVEQVLLGTETKAAAGSNSGIVVANQSVELSGTDTKTVPEANSGIREYLRRLGIVDTTGINYVWPADIDAAVGRFYMPFHGTVQEIRLYITAAITGQKFKFAIYTNNTSDYPADLVVESAEETITCGANEWISVNISALLNKNQRYWFFWNSENSISTNSESPGWIPVVVVSRTYDSTVPDPYLAGGDLYTDFNLPIHIGYRYERTMFDGVESVTTPISFPGSVIAISSISQILAGVNSISEPQANAGTVTANQEIVLSGTNTKAQPIAIPGTVIASTNISQILFGKASFSTAKANFGTLVANQNQLLTGINTKTLAIANTGIVTANQTIALTGIDTKTTPKTNPGTVVAGSSVSQVLDGISSVSLSVSNPGTLVANQKKQLTGIDTKAVAASSPGVVAANQIITLNGTDTKAAPAANSGTITTGTGQIIVGISTEAISKSDVGIIVTGQVLLGTDTQAVIISNPGTIVAGGAVVLAGIEASASPVSDVGTAIAAEAIKVIGVPAVSETIAIPGTVSRGVAVRAPPAEAAAESLGGSLILGKILIGISAKTVPQANLGFLFTGIELEKPIINPSVNRITVDYSINRLTTEYSINLVSTNHSITKLT